MKEFKCQINKCREVFYRRRDLKDHFNAVHLKLKNYPCKFCEKPFPTESNRKRHVVLVHEKERKYVCHICWTDFQTDQHLTNHKNEVHFKIKQKCEYCDTYTSKNNMKRHVNKFHPQNQYILVLLLQNKEKFVICTYLHLFLLDSFSLSKYFQ